MLKGDPMQNFAEGKALEIEKELAQKRQKEGIATDEIPSGTVPQGIVKVAFALLILFLYLLVVLPFLYVETWLNALTRLQLVQCPLHAV